MPHNIPKEHGSHMTISWCRQFLGSAWSNSVLHTRI